MSHETLPSGRPRIHAEQDAPMDNYNARLTAWHARMARKFGEGNLSEGIRFCISFAVRNNKDEPKA